MVWRIDPRAVFFPSFFPFLSFFLRSEKFGFGCRTVGRKPSSGYLFSDIYSFSSTNSVQSCLKSLGSPCRGTGNYWLALGGRLLQVIPIYSWPSTNHFFLETDVRQLRLGLRVIDSDASM